MHKFDPGQAHRLNDPERPKHENPQMILKAAGIRSGMTVVDAGCGTGFYTFPASGLIGEKGLVYAVDMSKEMLKILKREIEKQNVKNVRAVVSEETSIPLDDGIADMVINVNMLHEAYDMDAFVRELKRLMKNNGILLLIDHKKEPMPSGPPLQDRVSYEDATTLLKRWFDIVLKGPSGEYQYGLIAVKENNGR